MLVKGDLDAAVVERDTKTVKTRSPTRPSSPDEHKGRNSPFGTGSFAFPFGLALISTSRNSLFTGFLPLFLLFGSSSASSSPSSSSSSSSPSSSPSSLLSPPLFPSDGHRAPPFPLSLLSSAGGPLGMSSIGVPSGAPEGHREPPLPRLRRSGLAGEVERDWEPARLDDELWSSDWAVVVPVVGEATTVVGGTMGKGAEDPEGEPLWKVDVED